MMIGTLRSVPPGIAIFNPLRVPLRQPIGCQDNDPDPTWMPPLHNAESPAGLKLEIYVINADECLIK